MPDARPRPDMSAARVRLEHAAGYVERVLDAVATYEATNPVSVEPGPVGAENAIHGLRAGL